MTVLLKPLAMVAYVLRQKLVFLFTLFLHFQSCSIRQRNIWNNFSTSLLVSKGHHFGRDILAAMRICKQVWIPYTHVQCNNTPHLELISDFNLKRVIFRTVAVLLLLFIAESIPEFGNILDIVGATAMTLLTFVCPPLFYMRLCDASNRNRVWKERYNTQPNIN